LAEWRKQAEKGQHEALKPKKRGPTPRVVDARDKRIAELERENARLGRRIEQAEAIIDVQKKVSQLLGIVLPTVKDREPDGES
jgi:hypothetical protein